MRFVDERVSWAPSLLIERRIRERRAAAQRIRLRGQVVDGIVLECCAPRVSVDQRLPPAGRVVKEGRAMAQHPLGAREVP